MLSEIDTFSEDDTFPNALNICTLTPYPFLMARIYVFLVATLLACGSSTTTSDEVGIKDGTGPQPVNQIQTPDEPSKAGPLTTESASSPTPSDEEAQDAPILPKKRPTIAFADPTFDFGEIFHADKVEHKFEFVNRGQRDLEIKSAKASCGCTTPSYPFLPIAPGESGFIGVTYNSVGKQGFQRATIRVRTNDPEHPEVVLKLRGRVKVKPRPEKEDS